MANVFYKAVIQEITTFFPADQAGSGVTQADVYIQLYDINTGALVAASGAGSGNGLTVYYAITDQNGNVTPGSVQILGNSQLIASGAVVQDYLQDAQGNLIHNYTNTYTVSRIDLSTQGNAAGQFNDLRIASVNVTNVSAQGAGDGKAIITATSSHLPITYSLDGVTYQGSNLFSGLQPGTFTVYCQDSAANIASVAFQVQVIGSVLVADPSKTVDIGNVSRWNAAFNPIVFQYQRQDIQITSIAQATGGGVTVTMQTAVIGVLPKNGEVIFINAGPYVGQYVILSNSGNQLTILTPYLGTATGYVNINSERLYYKVYTQIKYIDPDTGLFVTQQISSSPNSTGLSICDISGVIRAIMKAKDLCTYSQANYCDPYLSVSYQISYKESWNGNAGTFINMPQPYYAIYAAFQMQEQGSDNLGPYVPFAVESNPTLKAAWLTDFAMPVLFNGQPFDLPFIYSENLAGLALNVAVSYLDINFNVIGSAITSSLLNENGSFLLNQDSSKLLISKNLVAGGSSLAQQIGLNRLNLTATYPANVYYLDVVINYVNSAGATVEVTKHITVKISDQFSDYPVYLKWIGKHGGWNYYQFGYNQDISLNVQNMQLITRRVSSYPTAHTREDVVSKVANRKITVYAEDVPVTDILGIESIYDSPKVMMLQPSGLWQTVIVNTASYKLYDSRDDHAAVKFTIDLPTKNVQTQ